MKFGNGTLSVREWLAADGDARDPADGTVAAGFACDPDGCVARLPDRAVGAVSRTAAAFADDCIRAALIVTLRTQAGLQRAWAEGNKSGRKATLNDAQRDEVRAAVEAGTPIAHLARDYDTSRQTIMRAPVEKASEAAKGAGAAS